MLLIKIFAVKKNLNFSLFEKNIRSLVCLIAGHKTNLNNHIINIILCSNFEVYLFISTDYEYHNS